MQNDRLLRQLNADVLKLQQRSRSHIARQLGVPAVLAALPADARARATRLAAEVLQAAAEGAAAELGGLEARPSAAAVERVLDRHLYFVDVAGSALAAPMDLRAQLVRLAALLDAQGVSAALQKQVRPLLAASLPPGGEPVAVLGRRLEAMRSAAMAARLA